MRKIVEYRFATGGDEPTFEASVAGLIREGYQPYGEPKLLQPTGNFHGFFQAMVKYEEPIKAEVEYGGQIIGTVYVDPAVQKGKE
jgi:hypothetical protein